MSMGMIGGEKVIEWKRYSIDNPPEKHKNYLVYTGRDVVAARYDLRGILSEEMTFHRIEDGRLRGEITKVTHYAELNLPGLE